MKKNNHLLSLLLIMALTSLNAGAQNLFSPITKLDTGFAILSIDDLK